MLNTLLFMLMVFELRGVFSVLQNHYSHQITNIHANTVPIIGKINEHHKISPLIPAPLHPANVQSLSPKVNARKSKGINLAFPITHQYLLPNLHVIPIHSNVHGSPHSDINHHVTNENIKLLTHTSNGTHSLIPILIPLPYHDQFVHVQDLRVIPLHGSIQNDHQLSQFRAAMEKKKNEDEDAMNRFRSFYGGYGTGLFFGGHGAGHGFYAYG